MPAVALPRRGALDTLTQIKVCGAEGPIRGIIESDVRNYLINQQIGIDFVGTRKTAFERQLFTHCIRILNEFRGAFGLPPLRLRQSNFHVLQPEEFERSFSQLGSSGGVTTGEHVFIRRFDDPVMTVITLSHETAHLSCYKIYEIDAKQARLKDGTLSGELNTIQILSGIRYRHYYLGLNEAITEIIGGCIRDELVKIPGVLTPEQCQELDHIHAYLCQMIFLEYLVKKVWGDFDQGTDVAIWDYMTGSSSFLSHLRHAIPGCLKILRHIDDSDESVINAACDMGFLDLAQELEEICAASQRIP